MSTKSWSIVNVLGNVDGRIRFSRTIVDLRRASQRVCNKYRSAAVQKKVLILKLVVIIRLKLRQEWSRFEQYYRETMMLFQYNNQIFDSDSEIFWSSKLNLPNSTWNV
jgi:hypothetical protein